jgi:hypothetical protein
MDELLKEIQDIVETDSSEKEEIVDENCDSCWHLQEAMQFVAEDMAELTGLSAEVLSAVLLEAMSCDSDCKKRYVTQKGDFKGGKGVAFDTCIDYAKNCCTGVNDPSAFCAFIGRKAGKIK